MAPDRPRAASRERAERAYQLKCQGHTWRQIADQLGFKTHSSAVNAVKRYVLSQPPETIETMRAYTGGSYRIVSARLHRLLEKAENTGDLTGAASLGRAIADIEEKHAKLTGQHVVVAKEVEVNHHVEIASTARGVVDQAEQDLLAIAAGHRDAGMLPVIDAEVIEA